MFNGQLAESLGIIGNTNTVPFLLETLKDPNENVRRASASALGFIGILKPYIF